MAAITPGTAVSSGTVTAINSDGTVNLTMQDGVLAVALSTYPCSVGDTLPALNIRVPGGGITAVTMQPLSAFGVRRVVKPGDDIQAAIDAVSAAGGGIVRASNGNFTNDPGSPLIPKSNVVVRGNGKMATTFSCTGDGNVFNNGAQAFSNFRIENIGFTGSVNEFPSAPKRARTTSGVGTTTAIQIDGSLDPNGGTHPTVSNFELVNIRVANCSSLPIRLFGISGITRVQGCDFENCLDAGGGFCEEFILIGNHAKMSADNGFSISRGNHKVVVVGNTAENCAYDGIWLSGFAGDAGPRYFSCSGNTVTDIGMAGIRLAGTPKFGTVTGNTIDKAGRRGPSDQADDTFCCGIYLESATGVNVTGNTVVNAPRAGIYGKGMTGSLISGNLLYNIGSQFLADGTTTILSSDVTTNIGVLTDTAITNKDVLVSNNAIFDERTGGGNWLNAGVVAVTGVTDSNNLTAGHR